MTLTSNEVEIALRAWLREHQRLRHRLRGNAGEYQAELAANAISARRTPWFNRVADKWLRSTREADFPSAGTPEDRLIFGIECHCREAGKAEFFLGCRDAAVLATINYRTAARVLARLVDRGVLEPLTTQRKARHACEYRYLPFAAEVALGNVSIDCEATWPTIEVLPKMSDETEP